MEDRRRRDRNAVFEIRQPVAALVGDRTIADDRKRAAGRVGRVPILEYRVDRCLRALLSPRGNGDEQDEKRGFESHSAFADGLDDFVLTELGASERGMASFSLGRGV